MNQTTKSILACFAILLVVGIGVAVKMIWFPTIKDAWFQNPRQLRLAPRGLFVMRPTHFPKAPTNEIFFARSAGGERTVGRNLTFQQLIAMAYDYNPGRVSLPPGAPKNTFDILDTIPSNREERLKKIILSQTGYSATVQTQDVDVLALKVENPNSPNLTPSGPDEKPNMNFKNGRLYLKHMKLQEVTGGLENYLKIPVVDETGMSNFYDFSLDWSQGMNPNNLSKDDFDKIVNGWGLKLEPDTESVQMLVVKKTD
jgi:uncharacterized protein (TIGR03435 family)